MKKLLASLFVAVMLLTAAPLNGFVRLDLFTVSANAADIVETGSCGENVTYTLDSDGNLVISGTGSISYGFGESSYKGRIKTVTIEDGITGIASGSFLGLVNLTSISIPKSVNNIEAIALVTVLIESDSRVIDFGKLKAINVDPENESYYSEDGVLYNKDKTTIIQYPASKEDKTFDVPDGVTNIESRAFLLCINLESIRISASVNNIGSFAFITSGPSDGTISKLKEYIVDPANESFCSVNGILYSKDKTVLVSYPGRKSEKTFTIPSNVKRISEGAFASCTNLVNVTIPDSVTSIDDSAFVGCEGLTEVVIPGSVKKISDCMFISCYNLTSVKLCDGVTSIGDNVVDDCSNLQYIFIPKSVKQIGYGYQYSWYYDKMPALIVYEGLEEDWNSIEKPGEYYSVIYNCKIIESNNMRFIATDGNAALIKYFGDSAEVKIPSEVEGYTVTAIGDNAFMDCSNLKYLTIPKSIKNITNKAFDNANFYSLKGIFYEGSKSEWNEITDYDIDSEFFYCNSKELINYEGMIFRVMGDKAELLCALSGLENDVIIPSKVNGYNVTSIGPYAFYNCTDLTRITIPENVTFIGDYAFARCSAVEEIIYNAKQAKVDEYGGSVFAGCGEKNDGINLAFGNSVEYITGKMFETYTDYAYVDDEWTEVTIPQANIKSITIGENVKYIGEGTFSNLDSLKILNYNATNYLGSEYRLFKNCDNLTTVNIGDNVKTIPNYFLYGCDGIESITIPESVEKIGKYAFNDCSNLTDEIFEGNNKINIGAELNKGSNNAYICCYENSFLHSYADINGLRYKIINTDNDTFEIKNEVLIKYNGENEFVYFNAANKIGYNAFYGNEALKSVELSGRVNRIYDKAFENCSNLEKIIIPQSITSIGDQAFKGCDKLIIWCYAGSFAEQFALTHNIPIHYITMEISDTVVELNTFDVCQLNAALNVDLTEDELHWTSDNPDVVTVSPDGKLTAVGVGKATITATSSSGLSVKCIVTVSDESEPEYVESVSINDLNLYYNRTAKLDLTVNSIGNPEYTVKYTSSNPKVATVDQNGNVKTTGKGTATITVTVTDSLGNVVTDTCNVNVKFNFGQWLLYIICFGWIWM